MYWKRYQDRRERDTRTLTGSNSGQVMSGVSEKEKDKEKETET
jgi:hypothetical protein